MKCERCGQRQVNYESTVMVEASGADAVVLYSYKGIGGVILAAVCEACEHMLHNLGWKIIIH